MLTMKLFYAVESFQNSLIFDCFDMFCIMFDYSSATAESCHGGLVVMKLTQNVRDQIQSSYEELNFSVHQNSLLHKNFLVEVYGSYRTCRKFQFKMTKNSILHICRIYRILFCNLFLFSEVFKIVFHIQLTEILIIFHFKRY